MVSNEAYERLALANREGFWELAAGTLISKPGETFEHNRAMNMLAFHIQCQLDQTSAGRVNCTRTKRENTYRIPDVLFFEESLGLTFKGTGRLEAYERPLSFVAEVSSPLNPDYDEDAKIEEYRVRRDREIWLLDPYSRSVTTWTLQPGGHYLKTYYVRDDREAPIRSLPGVVVRFSEIFQ